MLFRSPDRDMELDFALTGGYNRGYGIFVESVVKNSTAYKKGLKRGDQILDVNGENFQQAMTLECMIDALRYENLNHEFDVVSTTDINDLIDRLYDQGRKSFKSFGIQ